MSLDLSTLTKGQTRKLNALRKSLGNEIADQDLGLHYIKLNEKRDKVIEHDYFLLNERVRDMVVSKDKKLIIIFLETTSSISILKKNS